MKYANSISIRVFAFPEDCIEEIEKTFLKLIGFSKEELNKEKIFLKNRKAKGFGEKTIRILDVELKKTRHCNHFLKNLKKIIPEGDLNIITRQPDRLDEHLNFFIRLNKKSLLEGNGIITDSGECFHIKINVAAYPRKKEKGIEVIKQALL